MSYFMTRDGVKLHYEERGKGQPLLFLHGWGMSSRVWIYQVEELSRDHRVITLDLRGHGGSSSTDAFSFDALAGDVRELVEGLSLDSVFLIGWSMGGSVAVRAAVLYPKIIKGLVLVGMTPKFVSTPDFPDAQPEASLRRMSRQIEKDTDKAMKEFCSLMFNEEGITEEVWGAVSAGGWLSAAVLNGYLKTLAEADLRDDITKIGCPTMIMHGLLDRVSFHQAAVYMADRIKGVRLETHHDEGHAPFLTRAEWFNTELKDFLNEFGNNG